MNSCHVMYWSTICARSFEQLAYLGRWLWICDKCQDNPALELLPLTSFLLWEESCRRFFCWNTCLSREATSFMFSSLSSVKYMAMKIISTLLNSYLLSIFFRQESIYTVETGQGPPPHLWSTIGSSQKLMLVLVFMLFISVI